MFFKFFFSKLPYICSLNVFSDIYVQVGGPKYHIPNGRKDARRSKLEDTFNLPSPALNASHLIRNFRKQGFSANEMVTLSGT